MEWLIVVAQMCQIPSLSVKEAVEFQTACQVKLVTCIRDEAKKKTDILNQKLLVSPEIVADCILKR